MEIVSEENISINNLEKGYVEIECFDSDIAFKISKECEEYVSNLNVKWKYLKSKKNRFYVSTFCDNKTFYLHDLIMRKFKKSTNSKYIIKHINSDSLDNRLENLEWVSKKDYYQKRK